MSNQLTGSGAGAMTVRRIGGGGFGAGPLGTLVFPATVNVADPAGLTDLNEAQLSVDATGRLRVVATVASGTIVSVQPPAAALVDATSTSGRVVAPGAGAVICSMTPAAGTYDVGVRATYDVGAPVANEINNMALLKQGVNILTLQVLAVINIYSNWRLYRVTLSGAQSLAVNNILAGTAGVGYSAELIAIRVA